MVLANSQQNDEGGMPDQGPEKQDDDANMRPTSMPPSATTPTSGNSPKENLDWGKSNDNANESLRLLGAGQPYMQKN